MLFVEALTGEEEIELVCRELAGIPLVFNWAEGGKTPPLPLARLQELGFAMVIMPIGRTRSRDSGATGSCISTRTSRGSRSSPRVCGIKP